MMTEELGLGFGSDDWVTDSGGSTRDDCQTGVKRRRGGEPHAPISVKKRKGLKPYIDT